MNGIMKIARTFCDLLIANGIDFNVEPSYDGIKFTFPDYPQGDVCVHSGTYGVKWGCVESYRFPWDNDDVTYEQPQNMVSRLIGLLRPED